MSTKIKEVVREETAIVSDFNRVCTGENHKALSAEFIAGMTLEALNDTSTVGNTEAAARVETSETADSTKDERNPLKVAGMIVAAPLIGLAFVIALPFIGVYKIAKLALEACSRKRPSIVSRLKNIGLFLASPFIALGYVVAMPVVGLYMFAKLAAEARAKCA